MSLKYDHGGLHFRRQCNRDPEFRAGNGKMLFNGDRVTFEKMEKVLEREGGDVCPTM